MNKKRIQPSREYPAYWEYKGKPTVLLGGSVEDNLFQIDGLEEHLKLLHSVGGNYVRCTLSSRDPGNVWPFEKEGESYDLNKPSAEYWRRFDNFLALTHDLDIIVQFEVWDRFDFAGRNWDANPFNPKNNTNYTEEESGLPAVIDTPGHQEQHIRFLWTVPTEDNNQLVLKYQIQFVDTFLSHALKYPHLLYCMDNETAASEAWGRYWARHIQAKARARNVHVHTTEMWDAYDLSDEHHARTFDHPETYSFCDVSQNNHNRGETHWRNLMWLRDYIAPTRPVNTVKIYGSDEPYARADPNARLGVKGLYGQARDGIERFWRNIFGGLAGTRFHRPPSGLGLSPVAQRHIRSMRTVLDEIDIFRCEPHNDLLPGRKENGAYAAARPGHDYAVYFPHGEAANIDLKAAEGPFTVRWLDIEAGEWAKAYEVSGKGVRALIPPVPDRHWAAVIKT
ncbi:MAG: hypothetical protein JXR37_36325 [Kiritimatiellae bacterium]|nr:hypothetical protein [Kiritimatiellia bacterium]